MENDKICQISTTNFLQVGEKGKVRWDRGAGGECGYGFEAKHFVLRNGQISILLEISFPEATVFSFSTAILKYFKQIVRRLLIKVFQIINSPFSKRFWKMETSNYNLGNKVLFVFPNCETTKKEEKKRVE